MVHCCLHRALLVVLLFASLLSGLAAAHQRGGGGTNLEGSPSPSLSLSLLTPATFGDGFLVINASTSTSNVSRVAFSLVPKSGASFSTTAPSRSDPSVVEVVVAFSNQRLVLLGLRLASSALINDTSDSVVYARELVAPVGPLGGVAVDWTRRRAFFAENTGGSVRAVSLDLPGPTALAQLPVFAQLPYLPYGGSLLGDLALDVGRDTLYVGLSIKDGNNWPVTAVWSVCMDGSGLGVARNLTRVHSGSVNPPVLALGASTPGSGSPRLLVLTSLQASRSFYDLTAFGLPLTPDSGNGTVLQLSTATDDPTGLAEDGQGWIYVADRRRGVARLRNNGTALTQGFIRLAADEPLVALGLVQPGESDSLISRGGRLLLFGAKRRFYAAPLLPPVNLTVLAADQGSDSVTGLVMDPVSCRMWYLENGGALVTRQANNWLPATRQITPFTYASSNLAINSRNQLYFARNFPTTGEVLRVDGDVSGGNMSVLVSSFGLQADGTAMATDPVGRKLYYLANGMVFRSELDGFRPAVYARTRPATTISSFALDVKQRLIFYSEGNRPGCDIYQAELDASQKSPVLAYSCPLSQRRHPPVSLASDPVHRVLYQLECPGTYPSCSLYAITLRSPSSDSSSTLLASFYTRLPTRVQFDPQHKTLFLSDSTGKTLLRCPLSGQASSNLTCFDLHLNPHTRLVAIAVDAPRRQLYAIDKPSYTVVRFELAEPDSPQPNLGNSFEVLHQLRDSELPDDYAPQHMQIDPDAGLLYLRTATGIGRGVMHHATPAPYSPIEPLINDSVVAFATDPLRQRIHWVRSKEANNHVYQIELWSAALDGTDARLLADWLTGSPCGAGVPVALHLDPPSPANASVVPPAFWTVWSTSTVCHWNGTVMRRVVAAANYGRVKSTAYDAGLQRVYVTGTYWQDVPTIFVADVRKPAVSMWKQKDAVALDGIAASAAGGELYTAQLASRSITSSQPVVFSWKTSELSVKRGEVLRAIPPAAALIDMQDPYRLVYFIDQEGSSVWTARSDGTGQRLTHRPIHAEYVNASAFWVDSALGLFYWTERLRLDTRVAHLDFLDHVATVLLVPLANSKTVLVDDLRGWIYWSDASQGRVMRARIDGGGVECFWIGEYYKMTQTRLQAVEPVTGDLIVLAYDASVPDVSVKRRSLATGEVSVLLSVRLGIFGPLSGLGAAQLDPRTAGDDGCLRLWLGAAVEANRADQGFIATACAGQNKVTRLVDLPQVRQVPWTMQLLPDLAHCLPPSGLDL